MPNYFVMIYKKFNFFSIITFFSLFISGTVFASGNIKSLRTGLQPNGNTRLVIEVTSNPKYKLSYFDNLVKISLTNTKINNNIKPILNSDNLIKNIYQKQIGNNSEISISLKKNISEIPKKQIMILKPSGDQKYRLVFDFNSKNKTEEQNINLDKTEETIRPKRKQKYTIVIDAGHGGKDPGCSGVLGTKEKDVVLAVAKKLGKKLEKANFNVFLTRNTDIFLNLGTRAALSERYRADLFISLHANSNPHKHVQGFSIYVLSKKASDEEASKLADAENASDKIDVDGFKQFSADIKAALSALQQRAVSELSVEYAQHCAKTMMGKQIKKQDGPNVRHAAFAVLRSSIPGVLIELGHLSNLKEELLLRSSSYQDKLAEVIANSVQEYNFEN